LSQSEFNILIVDDDEGLLSVLKHLFAKDGISVATSRDGEEAITRCRNERFDLVITDLMLPRASGLDVLREVRRIHGDLLVILITGYASLETAIQAIREGAYDYITKPFTLEQIQIAVKNALERVRLVQENRRLLRDLQEAARELERLREIVDGQAQDPAVQIHVGQRPDRDLTLIAGNMLPLDLVQDPALRRSSLVLDLERLSELRTRGHITEREFELCKTQLFQQLR
jgi:DNA-binding response OmpR family regulator